MPTLDAKACERFCCESYKSRHADCSLDHVVPDDVLYTGYGYSYLYDYQLCIYEHYYDLRC